MVYRLSSLRSWKPSARSVVRKITHLQPREAHEVAPCSALPLSPWGESEISFSRSLTEPDANIKDDGARAGVRRRPPHGIKIVSQQLILGNRVELCILLHVGRPNGSHGVEAGDTGHATAGHAGHLAEPALSARPPECVSDGRGNGPRSGNAGQAGHLAEPALSARPPEWVSDGPGNGP